MGMAMVPFASRAAAYNTEAIIVRSRNSRVHTATSGQVRARRPITRGEFADELLFNITGIPFASHRRRILFFGQFHQRLKHRTLPEGH